MVEDEICWPARSTPRTVTLKARNHAARRWQLSSDWRGEGRRHIGLTAVISSHKVDLFPDLRQKENTLMRKIVICSGWFAAVAILSTSAGNAWSAPVAATWLIQDGRARAEIVIAERPPRMVALAARELQEHLLKISGAKLPIATEPSSDCPAQIYVGRSLHTDRLGIRDDGLPHGAFRLVSGRNWLVLLGHDSDYEPPSCYFRGGGQSKVPEFLKQWDADVAARASRIAVDLASDKWDPHLYYLWKEYSSKLGIWEKDQRGSLNAVYAFLQTLGVRWYAPGELGQIIPQKSSIELPRVEKTVRPDFALRFPYQYGRNFFCNKPDEILWQLRMGFHQAPELIGDSYAGIGHGIQQVIGREEVKRAHPEYYKLENGHRVTDGRWQLYGAPCLTSPALFAANVRYVRAMFDLFGEPMISVMPTDGYVSTCQCDTCKTRGSPERGYAGMISDYVWDYVNRIAAEVRKTHPDRKVSCLAYGAYFLPPESIAQLEPNVQVGLAQHRCGDGETANPARRAEILAVRRQWQKKIPPGHPPFFIYDYYRYAVPGGKTQFLPVFFPHAIAADLRSLKGLSWGDFVEVYRPIGDDKVDSIGVTHLNLYVTAKLWWDADQDVDKLLDEYYALYYGPARDEMKAFIAYCEASWPALDKSPEKIAQVFVLLQKAEAKAGSDSVYAQRIAQLAGYLRPLTDLARQLSAPRGPVPEYRLREREAKDIRLDGRLDDAFWKGIEPRPLRETETGRRAASRTTFMAAYAHGSIYFGIKCLDAGAKALACPATKRDDMALFDGECVELLLETQCHSYYQIAVSPPGSLVDIDRAEGLNTLWSSNIEVATHMDDGCWSMEIRVPVADPMQADVDPNHGVAGRLPSETYPWHFNVARQAIRDNGVEHSAFSPTGVPGFHVPKKFATLTAR
jgi:hypothetical protein